MRGGADRCHAVRSVLVAELFGSCVAVLIAAMLYEALKSYRERLLIKARAARRRDRELKLNNAAVPTEENHVDVVEPSRPDSSM